MALSVSEVPFRMDGSNQAGWWKPLDAFAGAHYLAYNAWGGPGPSGGGATDTHTVYVARRSPTGAWSRGCLGRPVAGGGRECAVFADDVGHRQPSLAVDGDGFVHVFAAMHDNPWVYYRSQAPGDVTGLVDRSVEMPDQPGVQTYPSLCSTADGDVYLIVRAGPGGRLYRWDHHQQAWSRVAIFADQTDFRVYPDDVVGDGRGDLHLAWEWSFGGPDGLRHLGSHLRYEPAVGRFTDAAGQPVKLPVTTATTADLTGAVVYQPLEGSEKLTDRDGPTHPPGIQSAKLAVTQATGRPVVAYRYRAEAGGLWQVRLAEWTGTEWARTLVYGGQDDTVAAVDVSKLGNTTRVYYVRSPRSGPEPVVATRQPDGTWTEEALLPGNRVERLSVIRRASTDFLYLAAPTTHKLYFAQLPW